MKKYLYLLIACTMMCFAGCEEKGDEITTDNTGGNVEINEANLVGTWKIVSRVDTIIYDDGEVEWGANYYYEDSIRTNPLDKDYWYTDQRLFWNYAFTLNADHTYEYEDEHIDAREYGSTFAYTKEHEKENGTWSLKGKSFSLQWIEGCWEYLTTTNKADLDKPYEKTRCGTYEEYVVAGDDEDFSGYEGSDGLMDFYASEFDGYSAEYSISIIKLTSTELVVQTKGTYVEKEDDDRDTFTCITTFKKVK